MPALAWVIAAYGAGLLALSAIHVGFPSRDGALALSQVFAPHLFVPLGLLAPVALRHAGKIVSATVVVALAVGVVRFGPGLISLPPTTHEGSRQLAVLSWNLAAGQVETGVLTETLIDSRADLIGLQELQPAHARALAADPLIAQRYPYQRLEPESSVLGMGLLSRYPLSGGRASAAPPFISAVVDLGQGNTLFTVTGHPMPPRMRLVGGLIPIAYDRSVRDESLRALRVEFRPALQAGEPLLVFGDLNLTDREPAYEDVTAGMIDAHQSIGQGPGSTWRPAAFSFLPFGILRIDYVLTGGGARPLAMNANCIPGVGDHCILDAVIELDARQQ